MAGWHPFTFITAVSVLSFVLMLLLAAVFFWGGEGEGSECVPSLNVIHILLSLFFF